jgi:hypothetical protein
VIEIMGKEYLTLKDAAKRYGHSVSWFTRERENGGGPLFVQLKDHGRVLYPLMETDEWFKKKMSEKE